MKLSIHFATLALLSLTSTSSVLAGDFPFHLLTGERFEVGEPSNSHNFPLATSADGRFLVFEGFANNLIPGLIDGNGGGDIFVLDRISGETELISRSQVHPDRTGNLGSWPRSGRGTGSVADANISSDGRWVAFVSFATDLVEDFAPPVASFKYQIYLRDRQTQTTRLVSHSFSLPSQAGDESSTLVGISADGRFTVFTSNSSNLLPGSTGASVQVYLFDRDSEVLKIVSHPHGSPGTAAEGDSGAQELTPDGRYILINSRAGNLVEGQISSGGGPYAYLYDRQMDTFELLSRDPLNPLQALYATAPDMSSDGRFVVLTTTRALVPSFVDGNGTGRDCFLLDRKSGTVHLASRSLSGANSGGDGESICASVSHDGGNVYFSSHAGDLVAGFIDNNNSSKTDIFVYDEGASAVELVSHASSNPAAGGNGGSLIQISSDDLLRFPVPSSLDDRYFIFSSKASDLVSGVVDNTFSYDLFLYDRTKGSSQVITQIGGTAGGCNYTMARALLTADLKIFFVCSNALDSEVPISHQESQIFRFDPSSQENRLVTATPLSGITMDRSEESVQMASRNGRWLSRGLFLRDMESGEKLQVGHVLGSPSTPPEYGIIMGDVTPDGKFALYETYATNVAAVQDENEAFDVYVYERATDIAHLVSHVAGQPTQTASNFSYVHWLSDDGNQVLFRSNSLDIVAGCVCSSLYDQIYLYDRTTQQAELISHRYSSLTEAGFGDADFLPGAILPNAAGLLFYSNVSNLIEGFIDNNGALGNLYFYDRPSHLSLLVDHVAGNPNAGQSAGAFYAELSADGSSVFFVSTANDLVSGQVAQPNLKKLFRWTKANQQIELVVHPPGDKTRSCEGDLELHDLAADGLRLLIATTCALVPGDTNNTKDLYLYDRLNGEAELITHQPGNPNLPLGSGVYYGSRMSRDASKVFYRTEGRFAYFYDRAEGESRKILSAYYDPEAVIEGNFSVSDDGNKLVFDTSSTKVVPFDANTKSDFFYVRFDELFSDGFESGDTAAWTQTLP